MVAKTILITYPVRSKGFVNGEGILRRSSLTLSCVTEASRKFVMIVEQLGSTTD
jgi:hypothetical protein